MAMFFFSFQMSSIYFSRIHFSFLKKSYDEISLSDEQSDLVLITIFLLMFVPHLHIRNT